MSCFVVSDHHIHAILSTVYSWSKTSAYLPNLLPSEWQDYGTNTGRGLLRENHRAHEYRYAERSPGYPGDTYTFKLVPALSPVAMIKALQCLEYQCIDAGDVWLHSDACRRVDAWRSVAISRLPGYDEANWSINEP